MLNQTVEQDLIDIRFLRQMTIETEREFRMGLIDACHYQMMMSRIIARLEILEVKHGILVD